MKKIKGSWFPIFASAGFFVIGIWYFVNPSMDSSPRLPASQEQRFVTVSGIQIPLHNQEVVPEGEAQAIVALNGVVAEFFKNIYRPTQPNTDIGSGLTFEGTRRSAHPKPNGCLNAQITINSDLAEKDRVGLFSKVGQTFPAIARFSSGNPRPNQPDKVTDNRGFGLKVFGITDEHLLPNLMGDEPSQTQDFAMNGTDSFVTKDVEGYHRFEQIALLETTDLNDAAFRYMKELSLQFQLGLALRVFNAFKKIGNLKATNPLGIQYWSISAFQHGRGKDAPLVKYSLLPCGGGWVEPFDLNDPNFLRTNMQKHITQKPACFSFLVQDQTNLSNQIEDLTTAWRDDYSPFRELARIHFPLQ